MADYTKMEAGEMYQALGNDARKWTDAFMQLNPGINIADDHIFGWVCNMMMAALDFQHGQPVLCGDHAEWLQEQDI